MRSLNRFSFKFLVLAFLVNVYAAEAYAATASNTLIVLFGDSITVGFNSGRQVRNGDGSITLSGPRQFLSDILNNPDAPRPKTIRPSTVANWGEGGTNTMRGLQRIDSNLQTARAAFPGDRCIVLLMYGTNDFGFGLNTSTTLFNTRQMIRRIRSNGCTPVVGNLTPRSDRNLRPLSAAIGSVVNQEGAILVDQFTDFNQRALSRFFEEERSSITGRLIRLHPNDTGYRVIAGNWFNRALRSLIAPVELPLVITPITSLLLDEE